MYKGENVDDYQYKEDEPNEPGIQDEDQIEDESSREDEDENLDESSGYYEYDYSISNEEEGSSEFYQQYEDSPK